MGEAGSAPKSGFSRNEASHGPLSNGLLPPRATRVASVVFQDLGGILQPFSQPIFGETEAQGIRGLFKASFSLFDRWSIGQPLGTGQGRRGGKRAELRGSSVGVSSGRGHFSAKGVADRFQGVGRRCWSMAPTWTAA